MASQAAPRSADEAGVVRMAVSRPGIVLVHGACHHSGCWAPTVAALARRAPALPVVAVDLPGRGRSPVLLVDATIERCVDEVIRQINEAGVREVVLVGHSLAGVVVPGVAIGLGADRIKSLVFLTCAVPPEGGSVLDVLRGPLRVIGAVAARRRSPTRLPVPLALLAFGNRMSRDQRRVIAEALCPEAAWLIGERATRRGLDPAISRTWIMTRRDRGLSPAQQRRSIGNLSGVNRCIELDAPHDAMVSHPDELAGILIELVDSNTSAADASAVRSAEADSALPPRDGPGALEGVT